MLRLTLLFLPFALFAQTGPPRRTKLPATLTEVSGLVLTPDGNLWALNDGGNSSELFRFDAKTLQLLDTRTLPIPNRDWEDLTADKEGNLYIGDFGNNGNNRKDLRIYRYHPQRGTMDSILFRYPDQWAFPPKDKRQWNFDCEAMVFFGDSLHLFSKNRFKSNHFSKHYVLPAQAGVHVPMLRDSVYLKKRVVSGASMGEDGKTLSLTAYYIGFFLKCIPYTRAQAYFFTNYDGARFFSAARRRKKLPKCLIARQFESIAAWRPGVWLVANEGIGPQKAALWRLKVNDK